MEELIEPIAETVGLNTWMLQVFAIILAALLLDFVYRLFIRRLHGIAERTTNLWDSAIVYAGKLPISLLIWIQGLLLAAHVVARHTDAPLFSPEVLAVGQQLGLVGTATWFLFRLVTGIERAFIHERRKRDEHVDITTVSVLGRIVRIAVVLTGVLTGLGILEIPISGLLAAGGIGGLAVGLAARDLLANFFGGLMVFMDRPFSIGDWVRSPDRNIEGVVENIGWRVTTIRTFDRRPLYVPNAAFTTITLENPSRMTHRRIFDHIGVRYDDFAVIRPVIEDIRAMIQNHADIDTDQIIMVHFNDFGDSSLDIMVYCFTKTVVWAEYHRVREDVLIRIGEIIEGHGAEVAFPTRTIKMDSSDPPARLESDEPTG